MVLYFMKLDSVYPQISLKWNESQYIECPNQTHSFSD